MAAVTNLGDSAVTIATAALLFGCFLCASKSVALHWLLAVGACGVVTAAGKIALYVHGQPLPPISLTSPSGHVAASVLVYGVLPVVAARARRSWTLVAAATIGMIAVSRVYLQAHSESDVIVGACIGGACLAWFLSGRASRLAASAQGRPLRAGAGLAVVLCLIGAASGWRLHLDRVLQAVAAYIGS